MSGGCDLYQTRVLSIMDMKGLAIFSIIVVAITVVAFFFFSREGGEESDSAHNPVGLVVGESAIYVAEQAPSRALSVAVVRLEEPGFVAVHEDAAGAPGGILGRSEVLPRGETQNVEPIPLSRMTQDGETLYVILHLDDGDGVFDAAKDAPALDPVSGLPVMMIVTIGAESVEPAEVKL